MWTLLTQTVSDDMLLFPVAQPQMHVKSALFDGLYFNRHGYIVLQCLVFILIR